MSKPRYWNPAAIVPSQELRTVDLVVYGACAAGVVAAITARERGHSVLLLHPGEQIGGLTTGGLGWTDFGRKDVIGGRAGRFYREVGAEYGLDQEWRFEPHVAARVLDRWLAEAGVEVLRNQFLEKVELRENRIDTLQCVGGFTVRARMWIDASYEGDLLAAAGVSHTVGREGNEVYGETLNGIQVRTKHQFGVPVDPYVQEGNPASGLLPGLENLDLRAFQGQGDRRVQAYCFRMCMTNDPALRIDWEKPEGFDPRDYELHRRWFRGEKDRYNELLKPDQDPLVPAKFDVLPNPTPGGFWKTDTNNHGPASSDFIGANWSWPEASHAEREEIFQRHVRYQKGYFWFIANDPDIPERYRRAFSHWGLAADEFTESGNWPHHLYIREGRRMVADYVITEHDCRGTRRCEDPVGQGSYGMDSHNCTRFVADGRVFNEGDVQVGLPGPYPISYRSIVPRRSECRNLLVPVAASTSHIAFGSLRMEPVFMVLAESAAIAADLCLKQHCDVQELSYALLRPALDAAGQALP